MDGAGDISRAVGVFLPLMLRMNGTPTLLAGGDGDFGGTAGAHGGGELSEKAVGFLPVDAGVGDALSVDKRLAGDELLRTGDEVAFDHDSDDVAVARGDLRGDIAADEALSPVVLKTVGVAAIDHDAWLQPGGLKLSRGGSDGFGGVVDQLASAAQDDVALGVAPGDEDGGLSVLGVAEEGVRLQGGEDGVDGDLDVAGGGVFEYDRTGDAADELAMDLALCGARADGAPADQAGDVLRGDHVEELGAGGHAHLGEIEEEVARETEAVVDLVGAVEVRIVDEALPADGGAGLFEVDAHDNAQVLAEFGDGGMEQAGVFAGGLNVVDGAGTDDHEQARIALGEDARDVEARIEDGGAGLFRDGALFFKEHRGQNDGGSLNA